MMLWEMRVSNECGKAQPCLGAVSPAGTQHWARRWAIAGEGSITEGDTSDIAWEVRNVLWPTSWPLWERGVISGCVLGGCGLTPALLWPRELSADPGAPGSVSSCLGLGASPWAEPGVGPASAVGASLHSPRCPAVSRPRPRGWGVG